MRSLEETHAEAPRRKGGEAALEALTNRPRPTTELAAFARAIFQAGSSRQVFAAKWTGRLPKTG